MAEMTVADQLAVVKTMQEHYKKDINKEDAMMNDYSHVDCRDYASKGLGSTAAALGGTALGLTLLNGGLGGGLLGGINGAVGYGNRSQHVSQVEFELSQKLAKCESQNAILQAGLDTNQKIVETTKYIDGTMEKLYNRLDNKIDKLESKVDLYHNQQAEVNSAINALTTAHTNMIACLKGQVDELNALTKRVVPNTSICPGWGDVCVNVKPCP